MAFRKVPRHPVSSLRHAIIRCGISFPSDYLFRSVIQPRRNLIQYNSLLLPRHIPLRRCITRRCIIRRCIIRYCVIRHSVICRCIICCIIRCCITRRCIIRCIIRCCIIRYCVIRCCIIRYCFLCRRVIIESLFFIILSASCGSDNHRRYHPQNYKYISSHISYFFSYLCLFSYLLFLLLSLFQWNEHFSFHLPHSTFHEKTFLESVHFSFLLPPYSFLEKSFHKNLKSPIHPEIPHPPPSTAESSSTPARYA